MALGLLGAWTHLSVHHLFDNLYVNNTHLLIGAMLGVLMVLNESLGDLPDPNSVIPSEARNLFHARSSPLAPALSKAEGSLGVTNPGSDLKR